MNIKRIGMFVWLVVTGTTCIYSQTVVKPNYALKSHETLEILKVDAGATKTVINFSIENRIEKGEFCADKNIFIIYPDGTKLKLTGSTGIPVCPATYKFKYIGEVLGFTLSFPPLKPGTGWIDIVEDCESNCFSFYGVSLNSELNSKIDEALSLAEKGEISSAIEGFKNLIENLSPDDKGIKGSLYSNIITLLLDKGDKTGAEEWYKKLLSSGSPRLQLYINNLNLRGIKF